MNEMRKIIEAIEEAGAGKPGPKTFQQRGERSMSREQWKELLRLVNIVMDETDSDDFSPQKRRDIGFRFMEAWDRYNLDNSDGV